MEFYQFSGHTQVYDEAESSHMDEHHLPHTGLYVAGPEHFLQKILLSAFAQLVVLLLQKLQLSEYAAILRISYSFLIGFCC